MIESGTLELAMLPTDHRATQKWKCVILFSSVEFILHSYASEKEDIVEKSGMNGISFWQMCQMSHVTGMGETSMIKNS